jgi:hypothetical protein
VLYTVPNSPSVSTGKHSSGARFDVAAIYSRRCREKRTMKRETDNRAQFDLRRPMLLLLPSFLPPSRETLPLPPWRCFVSSPHGEPYDDDKGRANHSLSLLRTARAVIGVNKHKPRSPQRSPRPEKSLLWVETFRPLRSLSLGRHHYHHASSPSLASIGGHRARSARRCR